MCEARHFKCRVLIYTQEMHDILRSKGMCSESRDLLNLLQIRDNISETVQNETQLLRKTNKKSYVAYRMAPLPVTFIDHECHLCCLKPF